MTDILALDIATTCGHARGRVGSTPIAGSVRFASVGASQNAILASAFDWFVELTKQEPRPDIVAIEALLPFAAMKGKRTQNHDLLAYLHGVARVVFFKRGIFRIETHRAVDVRGHFIGDRSARREHAKRQTLRRCHALGWLEADSHDEDAADALALWSCACAHIDPVTALQVSPLFNRKLRVAV
jgi:Holliday junction resolvasome RuvABC endonuclease subunit